MSAHAEFLRAASKDETLAAQLKTDFRKAKLAERDFRMLEFVEKLTLFPWLLVESDVKLLRQAGLNDVEILHIVLGSAHFNYLNRMADGIGIKFEYETNIPEFKVPGDARPVVGSARPQPETRVSSLHSGPIAWVHFPSANGENMNTEQPSNLFRAIGANPEARDLARDWRIYQLKGTSRLEARIRTRAALLISGLNRCDYSIYWYKRELQQVGEDELVIDSLAQGKAPKWLSRLDNLLLEHARRLTLEPWTTQEKHIEELRTAGLDDTSILQFTMLASYMSFENRVALGLGVALESKSQ